MNDEQDDRLERLIGLKMDGRLGAADAEELRRLLAGSVGAREIEQSMLALRAALRAERPPRVPAGLREKTIARTRRARTRHCEAARVLPLVRRLVAVAAILLCATLITLVGGLGDVSADENQVDEIRTIEDEIIDRTAADGSLDGFLAWHFTGRGP